MIVRGSLISRTTRRARAETSPTSNPIASPSTRKTSAGDSGSGPRPSEAIATTASSSASNASAIRPRRLLSPAGAAVVTATDLSRDQLPVTERCWSEGGSGRSG